MVGPTSSESSDQMPCNITSIRSCSSRSSAQLATSEPHRIDAPRLQLTIFTGASCWPFSSLLVVRILLRIRTNCLYHSWVFDPRPGFFRLSMPSYLKRPIVAEVEEVIKSLAPRGVDVLESDSPAIIFLVFPFFFLRCPLFSPTRRPALCKKTREWMIAAATHRVLNRFVEIVQTRFFIDFDCSDAFALKARPEGTFNCEGEYHSFLLSLGQRPKLSHAEPTSAHRPAKGNCTVHP